MIESIRDPKDRVNQGVLITGMTGSGKTRMSMRLASFWRRRISIDPTRSIPAALRVRTFEEAKRELGKSWRSDDPMDIAVTFRKDEDYRQLFSALYFVASRTEGQFPAILVNIDEVDLWTSAHKIDPNLSILLRYGRHYGLSWIANCRADVDTHRDIRGNASAVLAFRQGMMSADLKSMLKATNEIRIADSMAPYPKNLALLKEHNDEDANSVAEDGVHFVALPKPFAVFMERWEGLAKRGTAS